MPALKKRTRIPRPDDPELIQAICTSIQLGHPLDTAGRIAGLGHDVAPRWYRWGIAQLEAAPDDFQGSPGELGSHAAFAAKVKEAEAFMVDQQLHHVARDAAKPGGWTAAMTLLERRRPQDFGRNQRVEVDQRVTVSLELSEQAMPALLRRAAERHGLIESRDGGSEPDSPPLLPEAGSDSATPKTQDSD